MNHRLFNAAIVLLVAATTIFGLSYKQEPKLMDPGALKALGQKIEFVSNSMPKHHGPCDEPRFNVKPEMGGEKVRRKMVALIKCAIDKWSVPGGLSKALDVAYCESGDNLWPWSYYDEKGDGAPFGCAGVFQQNTKYWVGRVHEYLKPKWFTKFEWKRILTRQGAYNARANVLVSIQMAHAGGWGPWSCA